MGSNFRFIDIGGADFRGLDLTEAEFYRVNIKDSDFTGATLGQSEFDEAAISHCAFDGALLIQSKFEDSRFSFCSFRGADFGRASLGGAFFVDCDLTSADFSESHFARWLLGPHGLAPAGGGFASVNFTGSCFRKASLRHNILSQVTLTKADFSYADLTGAVMGPHQKLSFSEFVLAHSSPGFLPSGPRVNCVEANFEGSNLTNADLRNGDFTDANFSGALLLNTDFRGANLTRSNFDRALLLGTQFSGAALVETNFVGVNLGHVDLNLMDLGQARM